MTKPRVEAGDRALETARKISTFSQVAEIPVADIAVLIQSAMNASRSAAIQECADEVREQKKKYPADIFQHIENFREVECWDCCGAATALHTMGWLADTVEALKER